jgi:hypothetical protein
MRGTHLENPTGHGDGINYLFSRKKRGGMFGIQPGSMVIGVIVNS